MAYKHYRIPEMAKPKPVFSRFRTSASCSDSQEQDVEEKDSSTAANEVQDSSYSGFVPIFKQKEPRVQIKAGKLEVYRRIRAFQALKRQEVNESNIQEFCVESHRHDKNWKPSGCARIDALVLPRPDSKTHIKVHRVVNEWGPYSSGVDPSIIPEEYTSRSTVKNDNGLTLCQRCRSAILDPCPDSIDERLSTAECHLRMQGPVPRNIYRRIKLIENRILALEGTSPEYAAIPSADEYLNEEEDIPEPVLFGSSALETAVKCKSKIPKSKHSRPKKGHKKEDLRTKLLKLKTEAKLRKGGKIGKKIKLEGKMKKKKKKEEALP